MQVVKRYLARPSLSATLLLLVIVVAWQGWNVYAAPDRMSPMLRDAVERKEDRLNITVTVDFRFEAYHLTFFQQYGTVVGVKESELQIRRVDASSVRMLAKNYWITHIYLTEERSP